MTWITVASTTVAGYLDDLVGAGRRETLRHVGVFGVVDVQVDHHKPASSLHRRPRPGQVDFICPIRNDGIATNERKLEATSG